MTASSGGGVIDAFYAGYDTINPDDFDYVCKLDLDLDIPPRYFEALMKRMEADPRIGTCSGKPYMQLDGKLVSEKCGDENSVGMIKFYRTDCFKQIGGFVRMLMWDGIDCHRCRMLGWIAVSWDDPEIRFVHLRPMGTSHKNWWTGRVRHGVGQYYMGTGLVLHARQRPVPHDAPADHRRRARDAVGLCAQRVHRRRRVRRPGLPQVPPQVPVELPDQGQIQSDGGAERRAGARVAREDREISRIPHRRHHHRRLSHGA